MDFDWKGTLSAVAPTVATALGGPLAGMATKFLASALLGDENASEGDIQAAIAGMTPQTAVELRRIDLDFKKHCEDNKLEYYKSDKEDRDSARLLAAKKGLFPQIVLSAVFIIGYFGVAYGIGYLTITASEDTVNQSLLGMFMTIIGVLTAAVPQILNFWFGSSKGSHDKNHINGAVK